MIESRKKLVPYPAIKKTCRITNRAENLSQLLVRHDTEFKSGELMLLSLNIIISCVARRKILLELKLGFVHSKRSGQKHFKGCTFHNACFFCHRTIIKGKPKQTKHSQLTRETTLPMTGKKK